MKNNSLKQTKTIFSSARIIRLFFTAWLIALIFSYGLAAVLTFLIPSLEKVNHLIILLIFYGVSAITGITASYFLTKKTNLIAEKLNQAIDRIALGDFSAKIIFPHQNNEIDDIVDNFNNMLAELNSLSILRNDFIATFSHEFKTPIVSIRGYAELLTEANNITESQKQYLNIIIDESKRLTSLSNSIMMLSKLDKEQIVKNKQLFSISEQIRQCILMFDGKLTEKNLQFEADISELKYFGEENLIKEIWINLLSNAIKFTPNGGSVLLKAKQIKNNIVVSISDTGVGIKQEDLAKVFTKFYQVNNDKNGIGLGLSISKKIAEMHGGTINATNNLPLGTVFTVILPVKHK